MTTITYFDLASEYYMAYPLDGLLAEAKKYGVTIRISKEPPEILKGLELPQKDKERLFALGIFKTTSRCLTQWFCIDAHDDSGPEGYYWPVLEKVDHYFKLNCNPAAFGDNSKLTHFRAKIHSLGCTFSLRPTKPYLFFPRLRPCKLYGWDWFSVKRRLRALQRNPSLQWHQKLREQQPDKDVFLVRRYSREAGHSQSNEECCRIFE